MLRLLSMMRSDFQTSSLLYDGENGYIAQQTTVLIYYSVVEPSDSGTQSYESSRQAFTLCTKSAFTGLGTTMMWRTAWCRNCAKCAMRKTPAPKARAPLQSIKASYPMQIIATDILGPFPESINGNNYILVVGDYFTRWVEAYAICNQEAVTVANKLTNEFFFRFSPAEQLHSNQGRQFESHKLLVGVVSLSFFRGNFVPVTIL